MSTHPWGVLGKWTGCRAALMVSSDIRPGPAACGRSSYPTLCDSLRKRLATWSVQRGGRPNRRADTDSWTRLRWNHQTWGGRSTEAKLPSQDHLEPWILFYLPGLWIPRHLSWSAPSKCVHSFRDESTEYTHARVCTHTYTYTHDVGYTN